MEDLHVRFQKKLDKFIDHTDLTDEHFFEMYKIYIQYLRHENDLMNQRTTWSMAVQGSLLVIVVYLLQKFFDINPIPSGATPPSQAAIDHQIFFDRLIVGFWSLTCALGFSVSVISWWSINAATRSQKAVELLWRTRFLVRADRLAFPKLMGGGSKTADYYGGLLARSLPPILVAVWVLFFLFAAIGLVSFWSSAPYDLGSGLFQRFHGVMTIRREYLIWL